MYEDIDKFNELKKFMEEKLEDYNMEPGIIGMDLVLFKDAIEHGMEVWMDGWMDGWMDESIDEWMNGWMIDVAGLVERWTSHIHISLINFSVSYYQSDTSASW